MEERTVTITQREPDAGKLRHYGYNIQIAKRVFKRGHDASFNLVWRSIEAGRQEKTEIKWKPVYAINWTLEDVDPEHPITLSGMWKKVTLDEGIEYGTGERWSKSQQSPAPGFILVKNGASHNIRIVIGIENLNSSFEPIYIDSEALHPGSTTEYQPQENLELWYEKGNRTAHPKGPEKEEEDERFQPWVVYGWTDVQWFVKGKRSAVGGIDLSSPWHTTGRFECWTKFRLDGGLGTWENFGIDPARHEAASAERERMDQQRRYYEGMRGMPQRPDNERERREQEMRYYEEMRSRG